MGIPGAGKSRVAEEYVARGYLRLNRDERGGSLRDLADALDEELAAGARRVVLDNTYLTRASRSYVVEAAAGTGCRRGASGSTRRSRRRRSTSSSGCSTASASLPTPEELRELARREPGVLAPTSQMRALRELEPPSADEGFAAVEQRAVRARRRGRRGRRGRLRRGRRARAARLGARARARPTRPRRTSSSTGARTAAPTSSRAAAAALAAEVSGRSRPRSARTRAARRSAGAARRCPGCRSPSRGAVDAVALRSVGASAAHRTLATTLGARCVNAAG